MSADAVQEAKSGHPGMPMGMADIAEVLWNDHMKHNPSNPKWVDRDRFVLSNGHGSMLLYSLLHLTGYPLSIEDIKKFRQFGSHTAGHPELDLELGIETTTGPLGQGITNAVGMASLRVFWHQNSTKVITQLWITSHMFFLVTGVLWKVFHMKHVHLQAL